MIKKEAIILNKLNKIKFDTKQDRTKYEKAIQKRFQNFVDYTNDSFMNIYNKYINKDNSVEQELRKHILNLGVNVLADMYCEYDLAKIYSFEDALSDMFLYSTNIKITQAKMFISTFNWYYRNLFRSKILNDMKKLIVKNLDLNSVVEYEKLVRVEQPIEFDQLEIMEERVDKKDLKDVINQIMETITLREQKIVELYFFQEKNITQIAKELNLSKQVVSNVLSKTLRRLRHPNRLNMIRDFKN